MSSYQRITVDSLLDGSDSGSQQSTTIPTTTKTAEFHQPEYGLGEGSTSQALGSSDPMDTEEEASPHTSLPRPAGWENYRDMGPEETKATDNRLTAAGTRLKLQGSCCQRMVELKPRIAQNVLISSSCSDLIRRGAVRNCLFMEYLCHDLGSNPQRPGWSTDNQSPETLVPVMMSSTEPGHKYELHVAFISASSAASMTPARSYRMGPRAGVHESKDLQTERREKLNTRQRNRRASKKQQAQEQQGTLAPSASND